MAGTKTSARNNRTAGRPDRPERPGELRIITPCNGGRHAYIHDPKTRRTARFSPRPNGCRNDGGVGVIASVLGAQRRVKARALVVCFA